MTTFRARTLEEARAEALSALGPDAVISATNRRPDEGLRGLVGGAIWEVEASARPPAETGSAHVTQRRPFAAMAYEQALSLPVDDEQLGAFRAEVRRELRDVKAALAAPTRELSALEAEVSAVRAAIEGMVDKPRRGERDATHKLFAAIGLEGPLARRLQRATRAAPDAATRHSLLRAGIGAAARVCPSPLQAKRSSLVAMIGPSGVGKTTTLAKLAACELLGRRRSVLLISCDTFRVGAVDQLQRFAHLMGARFAQAESADVLEATIASATEDTVLVDTSGRPPVPDGPESVLARPSPTGRERHVILCAPASTRAVDAERLARVFGPLRADALCVTKIDETDARAGILHLSAACRLAISLLCDGQRVPEDMKEATTPLIVELLAPRQGAGWKEAS